MYVESFYDFKHMRERNTGKFEKHRSKCYGKHFTRKPNYGN